MVSVADVKAVGEAAIGIFGEIQGHVGLVKEKIVEGDLVVAELMDGSAQEAASSARAALHVASTKMDDTMGAMQDAIENLQAAMNVM